MNWWTSEPVAYTLPDHEGHRLRFLIAEKRARISTRINGLDEFPDSLQEVNPREAYPIVVDKNLVCYGHALNEFIHERYPSPSLLPVDPVKRAQVRMLEAEVRSWYSLTMIGLVAKLHEVEEAYENTSFICGSAISIVDIALAPLLHETIEFGTFTPGPQFQAYVDHIRSRPSFAQSLRSSTPADPEADLDEDLAEEAA